jgi:hypothetical protein
MLTKSRLTIAAALAAAALAAPAASAMPADSVVNDQPANRTAADPRQQDMHASTVTAPDARGEHAASIADPPAVAVANGGGDQRSPDAVEPFVRPVVVETGDPASPGFDWTSAVIGIAAGLAFAALAGAAVSGSRPRRRRPHTV